MAGENAGTRPALVVPLPDAVAQRPDLLICRLAGAVQRFSADALAGLRPGVDGRLNTGHHSVLRLLADEGPRSQQALAEALRIDRTTMVNLVDELEKGDHLRRRRNPQDRRAYVVEITASGRELLERADDRMARAQAEVFAPMTAEEQRELARLLRLLLDGGHLPGFAVRGDDLVAELTTPTPPEPSNS